MPEGRRLAIYQCLKSRARDGVCEMSLRELAKQVGCSVNTLRSDLRALCRTGWLTTAETRYRSVFHVHDPVTERQMEDLERLRLYLDNAPYAGEALLKGILNVIVDSDSYIDNARPSFLVNPLTGQPLEYDRYYEQHKVAVEFHGPQHDAPTELDPSVKAYSRRRVRDVLKLGLSTEAGVRVIIIRAHQLSVQGVAEAVRGHLPLRSFDRQDERIALLDELCRRYRQRALPGPIRRASGAARDAGAAPHCSAPPPAPSAP